MEINDAEWSEARRQAAMDVLHFAARQKSDGADARNLDISVPKVGGEEFAEEMFDPSNPEGAVEGGLDEAKRGAALARASSSQWLASHSFGGHIRNGAYRAVIWLAT